MQCGYSRELFLQWSSNPKNCIILTSRTQPGTLSRLLLNNPRSVTLDVCMTFAVALLISKKQTVGFLLRWRYGCYLIFLNMLCDRCDEESVWKELNLKSIGAMRRSVNRKQHDRNKNRLEGSVQKYYLHDICVLISVTN
jgi:hypothetical protein